jgi:hypothetical protein
MATVLHKVSDEEIDARAKMAGFIDSVIEAIESTPKPHSSSGENDPTSAKA